MSKLIRLVAVLALFGGSALADEPEAPPSEAPVTEAPEAPATEAPATEAPKVAPETDAKPSIGPKQDDPVNEDAPGGE